ncbi:ABC transporter [Halobacteriales archaeon QS_4_69_34]|nr:MAG: ABC transporter [Halobacteriales archaeon QS_4_69_34]
MTPDSTDAAAESADAGESASDDAGVGDTTADDTGVGSATADDTPAVSLVDVRKTYRLGEPVHALDGVSFTAPRGSYTAVMGPSGSGKSTLMNLVGCLDTPTAGAVVVDGRDVAALSADGKARLRAESVGFVFQTFNLMPRLTAAENVALPLVFRDRPRREREQRARELLTRVGLGDRADHRPSELSGGQRQRVAIARALTNEPDLLLADEPTGNLDAETGIEIMALFERLHRAGNTILMVTHERHVAEHAERIVHVLDGRIERIETVAQRRPITGPVTEDTDGIGREDAGANGHGNGIDDERTDSSGREDEAGELRRNVGEGDGSGSPIGSAADGVSGSDAEGR